MNTLWILVISISIFSLFVFLFYKVTSKDVKKEYGPRMWKHWPSRLYYWQAAVLYSTGFTVITICLLKWSNIINF